LRLVAPIEWWYAIVYQGKRCIVIRERVTTSTYYQFLEWISSREGCSLLDDDHVMVKVVFLNLFLLFRWDIWYHSGVMFWNSILHIHNYHLIALPTRLYSELLLYGLWPVVLRQNIWDISFLLFQNHNLGRSFLQIGKL